METVGIRELKTHLSRHLKRVRSGARLLVTERGRSNRDRGPPVTLYVDTSSLVRLYVTESGADVVRQLVGHANIVATLVVAYAETRAALARLRREGVLTAARLASVKKEFEEQVDVSDLGSHGCRVSSRGRAGREVQSSRLRQHPPRVLC